jgi:hypothetical protein
MTVIMKSWYAFKVNKTEKQVGKRREIKAYITIHVIWKLLLRSEPSALKNIIATPQGYEDN